MTPTLADGLRKDQRPKIDFEGTVLSSISFLILKSKFLKRKTFFEKNEKSEYGKVNLNGLHRDHPPT